MRRIHLSAVKTDKSRKQRRKSDKSFSKTISLVRHARTQSGDFSISEKHRQRKAILRRIVGKTEATKSAKASHLRYITDDLPGITRKRNRKGFLYFDPHGRRLREAENLRRIKTLAIPPAWEQVWISPWADSHLQATGRDARGRKQHRYHPRWREVRDQTKFDRMSAFGRVLPSLRRRLSRDLARPGLPRDKVLATVVKLLETTFIRVGNEEYARHNRSFGLTTMRSKHVKVTGAKMQFQFRGKGGKTFSLDFNDRRLAKIVNHCQDLPGQELFQYIDEEGRPRTISSSDVNEYLREVTREDFTAKDFRTWAGTVLAVGAFREVKQFASKAHAQRNVVNAIETVASKLGNTRSVCRKCYIHPVIIDSYIDGALVNFLSQKVHHEAAKSLNKLNPDESVVMAILDQQSKGEAKRKAA
jgi:DNA topoisomerase I